MRALKRDGKDLWFDCAKVSRATSAESDEILEVWTRKPIDRDVVGPNCVANSISTTPNHSLPSAVVSCGEIVIHVGNGTSLHILDLSWRTSYSFRTLFVRVTTTGWMSV